jgi:hypothetical protein
MKIKDVLGTECEESNVVTILNAVDENTLVCKENRERGLKDLAILEPALALLDNTDELTDMLACLDSVELDKLYDHKIVKDADLLP